MKNCESNFRFPNFKNMNYRSGITLSYYKISLSASLIGSELDLLNV